MDISVVSISSNDQLDKVYILLNSLKQNKQSTTNVDYTILINLTDKVNLNVCQNYFSSLVSDDFKIKFIDITQWKKKLDWRIPDNLSFTYLKCFISEIFNVDKILYLDTDMVIVREGIEQLWNTDIEDYYLAAAEEPLVIYPPSAHEQLQNVKTSNYFNAGMMLLNLKRIKEQKINQIIVSMVKNWDVEIVKPLVMDQSLLNYYLKDKVKLIDYKFNNSFLVLNKYVFNDVKKFLDEKYNGIDFETSIANAVIYHFLGENKPWKIDVRNGIKPNLDFAFKDTCIAVWDYLEQKYKKSE